MPAIAASIALAPLENLSGDPSQDVLALGFVEDVASALSRFGAIADASLGSSRMRLADWPVTSTHVEQERRNP